jgi:hypothetical protein
MFHLSQFQSNNKKTNCGIVKEVVLYSGETNREGIALYGDESSIQAI